MLRKLLPILLFFPALLHAQAMGDIRGSLSPSDARTARFLNAYPQTEQTVYQEYQPAPAQAYRAFASSAPPAYTAGDTSAVTVYTPDLGAPRLSSVANGPATSDMIHFERATLLATRPGLEGGFNVSNYRYKEPSLAVKFDGLRYGADLAATFVKHDAWNITPMSNWFATASAHFSYGQLDYTGSGTAPDKSDAFWDLRGIVGHDFLLGHNGVSPYTGFGYRYLMNDFRGLTSTGANGYRRESQYLYVPIGTTLRVDLFGNGSRVSLNGEYDYFILGQQRSYLEDIANTSSIINNQHSGFGLRGGIMYEKNNWAIGPYVDYWRVRQSDTRCSSGALVICGNEPNNQTFEYGLRATYRFWNF